MGRPRTERLLLLRALLRLVHVHHLVRRKRFDRLFVDEDERPFARAAQPVDPAAVSAVVDRACAWYFRRSNCFHRSAVLVSLLRGAGVDAQMICGVRFEPYAGHAWVEIDGTVINDAQAVRTEYTPVQRL